MSGDGICKVVNSKRVQDFIIWISEKCGYKHSPTQARFVNDLEEAIIDVIRKYENRE